MNWKRIDENTPRDGRPIWVCNRLYVENGFLPIAVRWRTYHPNAKGDHCWRDINGHKVTNVEFWMDLPDPPVP